MKPPPARPEAWTARADPWNSEKKMKYSEMSREELLTVSSRMEPNLPAAAVAIALIEGEESGECSYFAGDDWNPARALEERSSLETCGIDGDWGEIEDAEGMLQTVAIRAAKARETEMSLEYCNHVIAAMDAVAAASYGWEGREWETTAHLQGQDARRILSRLEEGESWSAGDLDIEEDDSEERVREVCAEAIEADEAEEAAIQAAAEEATEAFEAAQEAARSRDWDAMVKYLEKARDIEAEYGDCPAWQSALSDVPSIGDDKLESFI
jgi:hypothetical protein